MWDVVNKVLSMYRVFSFFLSIMGPKTRSPFLLGFFGAIFIRIFILVLWLN